MSNNFQTVNLAQLTFPNTLLIDYIRVYQRSDGKIGCDPSDRPTAAYIAAHENAYNNPNLTTWAQAGYTFPVSDACLSISYNLFQTDAYGACLEKLID